MKSSEPIRFFRIGSFILLACGTFVSGCGTQTAEVDRLGSERLEPVSATFITPEQLYMTPTPETEQTIPPVVSELTGEEEETRERAVMIAEVYNHPAADASKLGEVRRGDTILVLGSTENGEWYKINFNGRVAYIEAEVLGTAAREDAVNESVTPEPHSNAERGSEGTEEPEVSSRPSVSPNTVIPAESPKPGPQGPSSPQVSPSVNAGSSSPAPSVPPAPSTSTPPQENTSPTPSTSTGGESSPAPSTSTEGDISPAPSTSTGGESSPAPSTSTEGESSPAPSTPAESNTSPTPSVPPEPQPSPLPSEPAGGEISPAPQELPE